MCQAEVGVGSNEKSVMVPLQVVDIAETCRDSDSKQGPGLDLVVMTMLIVHSNDSPPLHSSQLSQSVNHVHLLFHSFLFAAHQFLHAVAITKEVTNAQHLDRT